MICHATNLFKLLVFFLVSCFIGLTFSSSCYAQITTSDCRTDRGWVDYNKKGFKTESLMYSECVRQGIPLEGRFHENDIRNLYVVGSNEIAMHPSMAKEWFHLDWFCEGCLSRVFFDSVYLKNEKLFKSPYKYLDRCPLPRFYEPSQTDLVQLAVNIGLRMRWVWGLCTSYSSRVITHPLRIGPGTVERLYFNADERGYVVSNELVVDRLKIGGFIEFRKILFNGDLVLNEVEADRFDLSEVVVLGNLVIKNNIVCDIVLNSVWVQKNILVADNTLEYAKIENVKVGGVLEWSKNTSRQGEFNIYDVNTLDIAIPPVVRENRTSGPSKKNEKRYRFFLEKIKDAYERNRELRHE